MNTHANAPTPARWPHVVDTQRHTCRRTRARRRLKSQTIIIEAKSVNSSAAALVADKRFKCTECGKCCSGAGEVWARTRTASSLKTNCAAYMKSGLPNVQHTHGGQIS
ncbi:hypothetical protein WJX79_010485 [Trebouxia sp. C0005]